jgi:cation:H+ antiporter
MPYDFVIIPWIGFSSVIFIIVYFISVRVIYSNEKKYAAHEARGPVAQPPFSLKKLIRNYVLFALIIIATALALPFFAEHIAEITGLGKSFVGTFFLAASTSLPEVAVSIAAVRMGSINLAVGNLLGSNIFNILILAIDDIFYTKGLLLKDASDVHILSVLSTIIMSAVVIIGLSYRATGKRYWLAWDAAIIFLIYFLNLAFLYHFSKG